MAIRAPLLLFLIFSLLRFLEQQVDQQIKDAENGITSEEEKQAKEDEAAKAELEADIAAVREDMMTAIAIGDDEWLDELRTEYNELVNGGE